MRFAGVVVVMDTGAVVMVTDAQVNFVCERVLHFSDDRTVQDMPVTCVK